jgi:HTH-type transcriptional regulator / antitoxin HigA
VTEAGLRISDLSRKDIGGRARASEVLTGRRLLSLDVIRRLNEKLGIPAEVLIRKTRPAKPSGKWRAA